MTVNDKAPRPDSSGNKSARLRTIGVVVLILGIGGAGIVYWHGSRSMDLMDDPAMTGYSRQETRQMETMYGTMGSMTDDLLNAMKRPGVQAAIIAGISLLIAAGCFYFTRPVDHGERKVKQSDCSRPNSPA